MTASNHALTGAVIGLGFGNPLIALSLAFISHFVLDVLPHYGSRLPNDIYVRSKSFKNLLKLDISGCVLIVLLLVLLHPYHWLLASFCAFVATLPDAENLPKFLRATKDRNYHMQTSWTTKIQWFERPPGAIVEIAWALAAVSILHLYL